MVEVVGIEVSGCSRGSERSVRARAAAWTQALLQHFTRSVTAIVSMSRAWMTPWRRIQSHKLKPGDE